MPATSGSHHWASLKEEKHLQRVASKKGWSRMDLCPELEGELTRMRPGHLDYSLLDFMEESLA